MGVLLWWEVVCGFWTSDEDCLFLFLRKKALTLAQWFSTFATAWMGFIGDGHVTIAHLRPGACPTHWDVAATAISNWRVKTVLCMWSFSMCVPEPFDATCPIWKGAQMLLSLTQMLNYRHHWRMHFLDFCSVPRSRWVTRYWLVLLLAFGGCVVVVVMGGGETCIINHAHTSWHMILKISLDRHVEYC